MQAGKEQEEGMSESIKTGGCGKSPAIEKINKLTALSSKMQAAAALEKQAFGTEQERAKKALDRKKEIIAKFHIHFKKER